MKEKENDMLQAKRYGLFGNLCFIARQTINSYPHLLLLCAFTVIVNTVIPVITTFLPKVVIESITLEKGIKETLFVTVVMTSILALCLGGKKFFEKLFFFHKLRMNTHYT